MNLNDRCTFGEFVKYVSNMYGWNFKTITDSMMQKLLRELAYYNLTEEYTKAVMTQIMANLAINPNEENFRGRLGKCPTCGSPVFARYKVAVGSSFQRIVICSNPQCGLISIQEV